jgi:hypothetical protein
VNVHVGDKVVTALDSTPAGDGSVARRDPGVVIDVSSVDLDGYPLVVVDFPWSDQYVVTKAAHLEVVDRPVDDGTPPPALVKSLRGLLDRVTELNGGRPPLTDPHAVGEAIAAAVPEEDEPPTGVGFHPYSGTDDDDPVDRCLVPGCAKPVRNRIHVPVYRLRWLEDVRVGDAVYLDATHGFDTGVVLDRREDDEHHTVMLIVDGPWAQRSIAGPRWSTLPCPLP